jgi:predicted double-glycine peptidase
MIENIVNLLFKWTSLRQAIFAEVNFYNSLTRIMEDPEAMKTAMSMWEDPDGWRGWVIKDNGNYYFNDVPEFGMSDLIETLEERTAA